MPLASFLDSMKRGDIINNTVRIIRCLKFIFLLTTVVFRTRIMKLSAFWTLSRREDYLGQICFIYISRSAQTNDCDCAFNGRPVLYWKLNIFTFEKWCLILNTRNNVEAIQIFHETFFGLVSFLGDLYNRSDHKTVNINHVLQVKKESAHIGYHQ